MQGTRRGCSGIDTRLLDEPHDVVLNLPKAAKRSCEFKVFKLLLNRDAQVVCQILDRHARHHDLSDLRQKYIAGPVHLSLKININLTPGAN